MKIIYCGVTLNTATATKLFGWDYGEPDDPGYAREVLYRGRSGEYFLHCSGGPATIYRKYNNGKYTNGETIFPLTDEQAREWAETYTDVHIYSDLFGDPEQ